MNTFINVDEILSVVDLSLTIAFWSIVGLLLLNFLIGLLRGWKQGTYRTLFLAIFAGVLLGLLPVWINIVNGLDLAGFGVGTFEISMQGQAISITPTTVSGTLEEIVFKMLKDVYQVKASVETISNYALALAGSAVRLVLVIVIGILTATIGSWLAFLLWHIAFKFIIPKPKRKRTLRIVSALEEALVAGLCLVLTIAPLTAMLNAVNDYVDPNSLSDKNETVVLYKAVADSYEKSILNQAFFAWTKGDGKVSLDVQLAEFIATSEVENVSANLITELRTIGAVGGGLLSLMGSASKGGEATSSLMLAPINYASYTVNALLSLSGEEGLSVLGDLSSFAGDVSARYDEVASVLGEEAITRLSSPRLKDASYLAASKDAYHQLEASGVFATEVDPLVSLRALPVNDNPYLTLTSAATLETLESISANPREKAVVESLLHGYLSTREEATGVKALMPTLDNGETDVSAFASYSYVDEAKTIVSTFHKLNDMEPSFAKKVIASIKKEGQSSSQEQFIDIKDVLAIFADHGQEFLELLIGPRDDSGEPVVNERGLSANGCLLDSGLINAVFPVALEIGGSLLNQSMFEGRSVVNVSDIAVSLQGETSIENIVNDKRELGRVLDIVGKTIANPYQGSTDSAKLAEGEAIVNSAKALIRDYASHPGIELDPEGNLYSCEPRLFQAVANGLSAVDDSLILSAILPSVADSLLLQAGGTLASFDITVLDTSPVDASGKSILGRELAHLLALGYRCSDLFPLFATMSSASSDTLIDALQTHSSDFEKILDIVTASAIFNPDMIRDASGEYVLPDDSSAPVVHNVNYVKVLNYLFSSFQLDNKLAEDALSNPRVVTVANSYKDEPYIVDYMSEKTADHENHALIAAIGEVLDSGIFDALKGDSGSSDLVKKLGSLDVAGIFSAIGDSYILKEVVPVFFDNSVLAPILNSGDDALDLDAYGISFANIPDTKQGWVQEGECFQSLINLAAKGIDLSNFDLFKEGEILMDIMSTLSSSQMFMPVKVDDEGNAVKDAEGNPVRDYVFPSFFSDKLIAAAGDSVTYFNNKDADPSAEPSLRCSSFIDACKALDTPEKWDSSKGGEFAKLKVVFYDLSKIGSFDALTEFNNDSLPLLEKVLEDTAKTDTFSTVFLGNAINDAFANLDAGLIDFSDAYTDFFFDVERDAPGYDRTAKANAMVEEVAEMFGIMELVFDSEYGLSSGSGFDMDAINLATISSEYFIKPFLNSAHESVVFHPTVADIGADAYAAYRAEHAYTVFEQIIGQFVSNSGVYSLADDGAWEAPLSTSGYPSELSIAQIITGIDEAEWANEIEALGNAVLIIQEGGMVDSSGGLDFSSLNDLSAFFGETENKQNEKAAWLKDLLNDIDSSVLLRRCLPRILSDTIDDLTFSDVEILGDLRSANFYFSNAGNTDYGAYGEEEVNKLVEIFKYFSGCMAMDPSDIATLDGAALSNALKTMETSHIFHSDRNKAASIFASTSPKIGHTAFENMMADVLSNDALESYLYYTGSPKDAHYLASSTYSSALSKALFLVSQNCASSDTDSVSGSDEIVKFGAFIDYLASDALSAYMVGGQPQFNDMDSATLASVLLRLNDCAFLADVVPSALDQTVTGSSSSFAVDGIDLKAADFYYMYDEGSYADDDTKFKARYTESEIDQICFIMDALKENQDAMSSFDVSTVDPMMLRFLLLDLSNSMVFHAGGARNDDIVTAHGWNYSGGKLTEANDLTVFEQFIEKIYVESSLYTKNFELRQSEADLQLYLNRNSKIAGTGSLDCATAIDVMAKYKLHDNILKFSSAQSVASYPVLKGDPIQTRWLDEISALTSDGHSHTPKLIDSGTHNEQDSYVGLIQVMQSSGFLDGSNVNLSNDKLNVTEPNEIYYLFSALNNCTIINEVLPNAFASVVGGKGESSGSGMSVFSNDTYKASGPVSSITFAADDDDIAMKDSDSSTVKAMASNATFAYTYTGMFSASDVASHYSDHFRIDYKYGSETVDVTALVSASSSSGKIVLDVSRVPGTFVITALDADGKLSNVEIVYDRGDYRLNQEQYKQTAIPSVYYFFASSFRGQLVSDSYYYSFFDGGMALSDFLANTDCAAGFEHSTFGLMYLICGSGIFDNVSSDGKYAAQDYAMYGLLDVKATVNSSDHELKMGAEFHPTLGEDDVYESAEGLHAITSLNDTDAKKRDFCFKEAAYLDQYIEELAYADVLVNRVYWDNYYAGSALDLVKATAMATLEKASYSDPSSDPYKFMKSFSSSLVYSSSHKIVLYGTVEGSANTNFISESNAYDGPGPMASKIISSIVRKFAVTYNALAKLDHTGYLGTYPGNMVSDRTGYMTGNGYATLEDISSALTDEMVLATDSGKLGAVASIGKFVDAIYATTLNSGSDAALSEIVASFDSATDGAKVLIEQFYMGDLYDYLGGGVSSKLTNMFTSSDVYYDFASDSNIRGGVISQAFSYGEVANILAGI